MRKWFWICFSLLSVTIGLAALSFLFFAPNAAFGPVLQPILKASEQPSALANQGTDVERELEQLSIALMLKEVDQHTFRRLRVNGLDLVKHNGKNVVVDHTGEPIAVIDSNGSIRRLGVDNFETIKTRVDKIEAAKAEFQDRHFYYPEVTELDFGKPNTIVLSIASSNEQMAAADAGKGQRRVVKENAPMGESVRASLDGSPDQVSIRLIGSPNSPTSSKPLLGSQNPKWEWEVTPKTFDPIKLTLSIFNEVTIEGEKVELDRPVWTREFNVRSSVWIRWGQTLRDFWGAFLTAGAALAGIIVAAVEFARWRRERRPPTPAPVDEAPQLQTHPEPQPPNKLPQGVDEKSTSKRRKEG